MAKNRLLEFEKSLNATIRNTGNFPVPENYGDFTNEVTSSRKGICFSNISNRGKLKISGKDHLKLLNGMITNDILKLPPGSGMKACILTNKGKMISDMRVFKDEDSVYFDLEPQLNSKVSEHLLKFRLSYKAEVVDLTEEFQLLHIFGPGISRVVSEKFGISNSTLCEYDHLNIDGLKFFKLNRTGETGFDVLFNQQNEDVIFDLLSDTELQFQPTGSRAMNVLRIEAGIPEYGQDMDENTIPIEAGLWDALNFEKGCYVGQEVVARIKWRGRVNRHLLNLEVEGSEVPAEKDAVYSGEKQIGKITSAAYSPNALQVIALGYIRREFKDEGSSGELIMQNGNKTKVTVREKPFFNNFI